MISLILTPMLANVLHRLAIPPGQSSKVTLNLQLQKRQIVLIHFRWNFNKESCRT